MAIGGSIFHLQLRKNFEHCFNIEGKDLFKLRNKKRYMDSLSLLRVNHYEIRTTSADIRKYEQNTRKYQQKYFCISSYENKKAKSPFPFHHKIHF